MYTEYTSDPVGDYLCSVGSKWAEVLLVTWGEALIISRGWEGRGAGKWPALGGETGTVPGVRAWKGTTGWGGPGGRAPRKREHCSLSAAPFFVSCACSLLHSLSGLRKSLSKFQPVSVIHRAKGGLVNESWLCRGSWALWVEVSMEARHE